MRAPIFARSLTDAERQAVMAGLCAPDAFVLRRCQILLASACGEWAPHIAEQLGCDDLMVLDALHAFHAHKLAALRPGSSRPHHLPPQAFPGEGAERLCALPHRSPVRVWPSDQSVDFGLGRRGELRRRLGLRPVHVNR